MTQKRSTGKAWRPAATVRNALVSLATSNVVVSPGTGSPNKLLYTNY